MSKSLEERVEGLFDDIDISLDMDEKGAELSDEQRELMEEVEEKDQPYVLALDDHKKYVKFSVLELNDGDPYRAEEWAKKSLKLEKTFAALVARANALFEKRDYKGALGYYDEALEYREEKKIYEYRYRALKKRGKLSRALESLKKALEIEMDAELVARCADLFVDMGDIEKAKRFYDKADELNGELDNKERKIDELLDRAKKKTLPTMYDTILELDGDSVDAWLGKAETYWSLGDRENAIECLKEGARTTKDAEIRDRLKRYREELVKIEECPMCGGTGKCPECEGTGDCHECGGSGKCPECEGSGECPDCGGTKECPDCEGTGRSGWFKRCETCSGTGICQTCNEYGDCPTCRATGDCPVCGGNGNCGTCRGSGVCPRCGGKGSIET